MAVFCGRSPGSHPDFLASAHELGAGLARAGLRLVFGGGATGMMAAVADASLASGVRVLGIIPEFLVALEGVHAGAQEIIRTDGLHARKHLMYAYADAFVALPGGLGTLDEVIEIITWRQASLHDKPVIIANVGDWADLLIATLERTLHSGFAGPETSRLYEVVPNVAGALARLNSTARPTPRR